MKFFTKHAQNVCPPPPHVKNFYASFTTNTHGTIIMSQTHTHPEMYLTYIFSVKITAE